MGVWKDGSKVQGSPFRVILEPPSLGTLNL